eukprot:Gb_23863 [translate_table: standard]
MSTIAIMSYALPVRNPLSPFHSFSRQKLEVKSKRKPLQSSIRCALPNGLDVHELGYDLYDLLGIDNSAGHQQIRTAYRWLQKKCHPDIAGPNGHDMAILLNQAYSVLSDPNARSAYDQSRASAMEFKGYTGQPLYSKWFGSASENRAVFVDEVKCVGCLKCALLAPKTFSIETVYGRARAVGQWAENEETVEDAIKACPVDCISWVDRTSLPALEFLMSKQPRVAVRMNSNSSVGARVSNVFVDVEKFLRKFKKEEEKASKFQIDLCDFKGLDSPIQRFLRPKLNISAVSRNKIDKSGRGTDITELVNNQPFGFFGKESPAQREARIAAAEQIRASAGWWWHNFVQKQAAEYTNKQWAAKGAIVHANWERARQSTITTDSLEDNIGTDRNPRIHISEELHKAAARRRSGSSSFTSNPQQALHDEEYWIPVRPNKSRSAPSSPNNLEPRRIKSPFSGEKYTVLSGIEGNEVNGRHMEGKTDGDWREGILSKVPLATSAAAAVVVGFGSGGGEAGGLETHLAGPLALEVTNSFALQVFLAASAWYVVGTILASVTAFLVFDRKKP